MPATTKPAKAYIILVWTGSAWSRSQFKGSQWPTRREAAKAAKGAGLTPALVADRQPVRLCTVGSIYPDGDLEWCTASTSELYFYNIID